MRRNLLGIVAALLLVLGFFSMVSGPGGESAKQFSGICIRSGLVLGALWLALPQIIALVANSPRWLMSWFVGKSKPASPANVAGTAKLASPAKQPSEREVPAPIRRPRRRSNS